MQVEIVLENDRRRGRVEALLAPAPVALADGETALRFSAGQPLVCRRNRQPGSRRERRHECEHAGRLCVRPPIEPRRQADHDPGQAIVLGDESLDDPGDVPDRVDLARDVKRRQRTGQRAGDVADGQTDPAFADVDGQEAATHSHVGIVSYNPILPARREKAVMRTTLLLVVCLCASTALAQQADRAQAGARRAGERLQALQREADQLAAQERTLLNDLRRFEIEREIKAAELRRIAGDADASAAELGSLTRRIDDLEARDAAERPVLRARLVEIYKRGRARYLRLLLSTVEGRDLGRAARMIGALAQADSRRVAEHQQTIAALTSARHDLEIKTQRLQVVRADAERAQRAAAAAARARTDLVSDIDRRRDLNAQLAGELLSAQQKLQATLSDLEHGAAAADVPALPIRPFRGALEWPVAGTVRVPFGRPPNGRTAESNGVEIAAPEGAPVHAVHEGMVVYADPFAGFGNLVIVDHGAQTLSLYGDLSEVSVARGVRIDRGQAIGSVGTAPAGAPGLYFELRVDGRPVDPLQWLRKP